MTSASGSSLSEKIKAQPTMDDLMGNMPEPKPSAPLQQLGALFARTRSHSITNFRQVLHLAPEVVTQSNSLGTEASTPKTPARQNFTSFADPEEAVHKKKSDSLQLPVRATPKTLTPTLERSKEASADLSSLLSLLHRLLSVHELKYTLELMESIIESDLGIVGLCCTNSELVDELRELAPARRGGASLEADALECAMKSSGLVLAHSKAAARQPHRVATRRPSELSIERSGRSMTGSSQTPSLAPSPACCGDHSATPSSVGVAIAGSGGGQKTEGSRSRSKSDSTQSQSHSANHLVGAMPVRLTDGSPGALGSIAKKELQCQGDVQSDSHMPSVDNMDHDAAPIGKVPQVGITGEGAVVRKPSDTCSVVAPFSLANMPRGYSHLSLSSVMPSSPKDSNSRGGIMTATSNEFHMTGFMSFNSQVTNTMLVPPDNDEDGARWRVTKEDDLDDLSIEQTIWLATSNTRWVLNPNNMLRVVWDLLSVALIVFECITLPMAMCFAMHMPNEVHTVSTIFFFMDIVLSFMTGYYHDSLLVMRSDWVVRRYLSTWFVLDVVSTMPWEALMGVVQGSVAGSGSGKEGALLRAVKLGKLMRAVRLLRLTKMGTLLKRLKSSGLLPASMYTLKFGMSACKMFVVFGFLSHWLACLWAFLGQSEDLFDSDEAAEPHEISSCTMGGPCEPGIQGSPWTRRYGLDNYNALTQYWASLQFTAAIMTGGDPPLHAGSISERVFTIILMICSIFIGSVVVGEVLLIMNRNSEVQLSHDEMMQEAREFMMARKVPMKLQARVYRYLESQHKAPHEAHNQPGFMRLLSTWLAADLVEGLNKSHICRHPFFKRVLAVTDAGVIRRICLAAITSLHASGDLVVVAGEEACEVFFLVRGKLRVIVREQRGPVYSKAPSWIGDRCLFVDTLRTHSVAAVTSSETTSLHKREIIAVCNEYPQVASVHEHFKHQILENSGGDIFRCPYCKDLGHVEETCPVKKQDIERRGHGRARTVSMRTVSAVTRVISARQSGGR